MALDTTKRQILLIDDDRDMAEMLAEYFGPEGFSVSLAFTAKAGLERMQGGSLVLVILDVMLPDKNGFTVAGNPSHQSHPGCDTNHQNIGHR